MKSIFESQGGKLSGLAQRYAKNNEQALDMFVHCFDEAIGKMQQKQITAEDFEKIFEKEFIIACVTYVKNIRSEYYVSSTVFAREEENKNYNLFESNEWIDYNHTDVAVLIKSLQQLVPSQRMVFNLHVVDGFSLAEATELLESGEETVKSNLEKARYNLQKNIEKNLKETKP